MDVKEAGSFSERKQRFRMTVNGIEQEVDAVPTARLSDLLRTEFQLTGTKISCGIGRCGACSVLLDGTLANACMTMAYQAAGHSITTIEGLQKEELDICQTAFLEEGGFQCGYCTPGMTIALKALFQENPQPTDEDIEEGLAGNLCRCTGYGGIMRSACRIRKELASGKRESLDFSRNYSKAPDIMS
ncbi:xanthine dehydrogenase subunit E [Bacillus mojavensis]|uniref:Xanthine dehydrogenase subunit E n=1 Tax=Bacillus mojavensis TaxID=72360 RepID=A0AAP3CU96_BACMO|nr:xanthine dehydrogenase subunit E [Bacillus mojavensis]MCY8104997.1 xanthine dehydrogenase subunit E [Bacillus mojavensis]MCY8483300.1 xanthine dehydrogenase subunit E [Bacillus mojavensis]MCY8511396.1 xanthine dehydrogenase subunit E [Bacillus mojavensis]MEC1753031.1 xanthine dehydrogenase subunit E [Bacillus mojavensis]MEC1777314.1 xanthine dehydrogenase subunit E [Bacillus mojavensis]